MPDHAPLPRTPPCRTHAHPLVCDDPGQRVVLENKNRLAITGHVLPLQPNITTSPFYLQEPLVFVCKPNVDCRSSCISYRPTCCVWRERERTCVLHRQCETRGISKGNILLQALKWEKNLPYSLPIHPWAKCVQAHKIKRKKAGKGHMVAVHL